MKQKLWIFAFLVISFAGCIKSGDVKLDNVKLANWTPDWALPLLNTTLSLGNLVKPGEYVSTDNSGLYSLHYEGKVFSAKASDYIRLPDQSYTTPGYTLTTPVSLPSLTYTINDSVAGNFNYTDTNGSGLEHINFKSGSVALSFTSTFNQNISIEVTFPNIKKNGVALVLRTNITYPATTGTATADLTGFIADLTNGGTTRNYMAYKLKYSLTGSGQPIAATNTIGASASLSNLQFSYIDGFLGRYTIPIPHDTIFVDIFKNTLQANIFLEDPKINLQFASTFGFGVSAGFDSLYGITPTGVFVRTVIPPLNVTGISIPGTTSIYDYTIDKTNSTVQNIFNPAPSKIVYSGYVTVNSSSATGRAFLYDTSSISLTAEAELPAYFKIINFSLQDTTELTLPNDTDILTKAEFKMVSINTFPVYGAVQMYFADGNYQILDSLVQTGKGLLGEAPVDANGKVSGSTTAISTFVMEHERYNRMSSRVKYAFVYGNLKTSSNNSVKIYNTNKVQIKMGVRFSLNVSTTNL